MSEEGSVAQVVPHYRAYKIRWIQLLIYTLAIFANALHAITFAPIESQTTKFFKYQLHK